jgi:hypothetical protein
LKLRQVSISNFKSFLPLGRAGGSAFLRALRAVFRAALFAVRDPHRVQCAADDVIADARQILDAAAAHENYRVLLQVVADPGYIRRNLDPIDQTHTRDFAQCRVGLLRRLCLDLNADPATLRAGLQSRARCLVLDSLAPFTY